MSVLDLVLLVAMVLFAITGWRRGLVYGLLSLVGFLTGAATGLWLAPRLLESWPDGMATAITAIVIVFVLAGLGQVLVGMFGRRLQGAVTWGPLVKLNNVGGALLSVLTLMLAVWFGAGIYASGNSSSLARDVRQSQVIGAFDALMPVEPFVLTGQIEAMFHDTGFPTVFAGLGPEPIAPIGAPDAAVVRREAVTAAASQTVKILGEAPSCSSNLEGSGFAFAPERVLTNAHVLAGVRTVVVNTAKGDRSYEAKVVFFDPDTDLAVLAVPGLSVRPLTFSDEVARGHDVAVLGYPENGGLQSTPARVRGEQIARGNDIYGEGVVVREVLSLRADVRPGNSGGPVVDRNGEVVGVVFAASVDRDDTGYAMTPRQVAPAIAEGLSGQRAVSTGPCA